MAHRDNPRSAMVIGLGRFGRAVALELVERSWEVLGIDIDGVVVQELAQDLTHVTQADCRELRMLADLGVPSFGLCVIARGSRIEDSIMIALNLQELGARRIVAKAATDQHARILERLGVREVVFPERDAGMRLAHTLAEPTVVDEMPVTENWVLEKRRPTPRQIGVTVEQVGAAAGAQVIAIGAGQRLDLCLDGTRVVTPGDILVLARRAAAR